MRVTTGLLQEQQHQTHTHTHTPLSACTHTHTPGHITPAFTPLYLILSNSSTALYFFFFFSQWLLHSVSSTLPYLIPVVSLMQGFYSSWDFQKYHLSGPESASQSWMTFQGISGGKYGLNMTQVL